MLARISLFECKVSIHMGASAIAPLLYGTTLYTYQVKKCPFFDSLTGLLVLFTQVHLGVTAHIPIQDTVPVQERLSADVAVDGLI